MNLTKLQSAALSTPIEYDIFLGGGRGAGKTHAIILSFAQFFTMYPGARGAIFRQTYGAIIPLFERAALFFSAVDPGMKVHRSAPNITITLSNGCALDFIALPDMEAFRRAQGNEWQIYSFEECQQWKTDEIPRLALSSLRSPTIPTRVIWAANPGDIGMQWVFNTFVKASPGDGIPFMAPNGRPTVSYTTMTHEDNEYLPPGYADTIASSTNDPTLRAMWLSGNWHARPDSAFQISENNFIYWYPSDWQYLDHFGTKDDWQYYLAIDWGTRAAAVCQLFAMARTTTIGGNQQRFVRHDRIILDEVHTSSLEDPDKGNGATVTDFCRDYIHPMCKRWGVKARGCIDDAATAKTGHALSIANEFERHNVFLQPAGKGTRANGWEILRGRIAAAAPPNDRDTAALYFNKPATEYTVQVLRDMVPDPKHLQDLVGPSDHAADSARYGVLYTPAFATSEFLYL